MGIISRIIGYPLGWIIWLVYQIRNNYAFSLLIFTLITRIIMFPFSVKMQKSTAAMQALQPKLEKLKKQYGNNQEKYNEATMQLYNEEGINPMASCLPAFIQFPILYGVLDVVYRPITHIMRVSSDVISAAQEIVANSTTYGTETYFKTRPELYIMQALKDEQYASLFADEQFSELIEKVNNFTNTLFGIADLNSTPTFEPDVWDAAAVILIIIPILSGIFQIITSVYSQIRQKKLNPNGSSAMAGTNAMFYFFPIFSVWIALKFPAGVGLYWTFSSMFALVQQIVLNKIYTPEYVEKLIEKDKLKRKNSKKQGMMERYQQLLAEQQAAQNGGKPVVRTTATTVSGVDDDDDIKEVKLSKSKQKEYERMLIREARRRQAEKYGEEYTEDDDD